MAALDSGVPFPNQWPSSASGRYLHLGVINRGSYGIVHKVWDNNDSEIVAVKEELHGMSRSTIREISILKSLPPHPSIVKFKDVKVDGGRRVFVVMEYVEIDLKRLMNARKQPYLLSAVKLIMRQILEGAHHLHSHGVMHRDIKPSNVLLDVKARQVKLCDFGLSTATGSNSPRVGTLWYKAPEVLKGEPYTFAMDMWSVGCIMAELVLRHVLFPGRSEFDQLACIGRTMGAPHLLQQRFNAAASVEGAPPLSSQGIGLMHQLLTINPRRRITARQALNHAWFKE